jgi:hypothetical protein
MVLLTDNSSTGSIPFLVPVDPAVEYARHDRASVLQCLRGRRLLLVGDSMVRQLAFRIMALVRGQETDIYMPYKDGNFFYIANRTHDSFSFTSHDKGITANLYHTGAFLLTFVWRVLSPFDTGKLSSALKLAQNPHFLIVGSFYWKQKNCGPEDDAWCPEYDLPPASERKEALKSLRVHFTQKYLRHVVWLTAPLRQMDSGPVSRNAGTVEGGLHRNEEMKSWVNKLREPYLTSVLDFAGTVLPALQEHGMGETADGTHFGCQMLNSLPAAISGVKVPAGDTRNCSDVVNYNLAQAAMSLLCGQFGGCQFNQKYQH